MRILYGRDEPPLFPLLDNRGFDLFNLLRSEQVIANIPSPGHPLIFSSYIFLPLIGVRLFSYYSFTVRLGLALATDLDFISYLRIHFDPIIICVKCPGGSDLGPDKEVFQGSHVNQPFNEIERRYLGTRILYPRFDLELRCVPIDMVPAPTAT